MCNFKIPEVKGEDITDKYMFEKPAKRKPVPKCISFRCLIRLLGMGSHWNNQDFIYHSP